MISLDDGTSPSLDALKKKMEKNKLVFPVLRDSQGDNFRAYEVKDGTVTYVVNYRGKVVWEGYGLKNSAEVEKIIKEELKNVDEIDAENWKKRLEENR